MASEYPVMMQRVGSALRPCASLDEDAVRAFPAGKQVRVRITTPRNVGRHRLYWDMLKLIAENLDPSPTKEILHEAVKFRLGYTTPLKFASGEIVEIPGSIAFDKMDEPAFGEFFSRFKDLLATSILPGVNSDVLEAEASEMLGGR